MTDELGKGLDTARPPEGDEDVYSVSTKVGPVSPEILQFVRDSQDGSSALKPARLPGAVDAAPRAGATAAEAADEAATSAATRPPPSDASANAAMAAVHDGPARASASEGDGSGEAGASLAPAHTEEGIPPLSMLVLAVAAVIAVWLGYQALHAPAATPPPTPNVVGH